MLTLTILCLAFLDSINPTIIMIGIFLLLYRGSNAALTYICSVLFTTFAQANILYFGIDKLLAPEKLHNLLKAEWILSVIGVGFIVYGLYCWRHRYDVPNPEKWRSLSSVSYIRYIKYIILGCASTLAETPTMLLLFLAVIKVQQANVHTIVALLYFFLYAGIYILPVIVLTVIAAYTQERITGWLSRRLNSIYLRMNIILSFTMISYGIFLLATSTISFIYPSSATFRVF